MKIQKPCGHLSWFYQLF